jgi:steroid delta-isomerase-like uncharacterized protein
MEPMNVALAYFDAWNRHDSSAIRGLFHDGGTYRDPAAGTLAGDAIAGYADSLFAAFADLFFEIVAAAPAGDGWVAAQWVMRGTHTGPLLDGPPTGRQIVLTGADFVVVEGDRIRSVTGYFDQKDFVEQLGFQVAVQPRVSGPIRFGTSLHMGSGNKKPGAISITRIAARSEGENAEIERHVSEVLEELANAPGFIGTVLTTIGWGGHTITAWETPEAPRQLLASEAHRAAMSRFLGHELAAGGMTSVWVPLRINLWLRCESCGKMVHTKDGEPGGECRCGASLTNEFAFL